MPPTQQQFNYDGFISYSSNDRAWAKKLADDLKARNLEIFYDRTSLDVGEPWQEQLDDSLDVARHLIVLWSGKTGDKKYVEYERTYFHTKARASIDDLNAPQRKEIVILLEDPAPKVRNDIQFITTLLDADSYAQGINQLDPNVWNETVTRVAKIIRENSNELKILVAVLATTRSFLDGIDFDKELITGGTMTDAITQMGFASKAELLNYYGTTFNDWCPFGTTAKIWTVLDRLKLRVAEFTDQNLQIGWEPIGHDLWSTTVGPAARREAGRLGKGLSLVVIDPISLLDPNVRYVLDLIDGCFTNTKSAIMVLTPYSMDKGITSLRSIIDRRALSLSRRFYEPPVPPLYPLANLGINVGDEIDMNRLVLTTLGQYFGEHKPKNDFLNP